MTKVVGNGSRNSIRERREVCIELVSTMLESELFAMCEQATNTAFIIPDHSEVHSWEKTTGRHSGFTADVVLIMSVFKVLQEVAPVRAIS